MRKPWTEAEVDRLIVLYGTASNAEELNLDGLSRELGRTRDSIQSKACKLGLCNPSRPVVARRADAPKYATSEERRAGQSRAALARIARDGHNRGMLGKRHTAETKAKMAEGTARRWQSLDEEAQRALIEKGMRTRAANGSIAGTSPRGSWKAGWREIGGKRNYYRSRWEANYARYLEWLKGLGEIQDWKHEPETFWFEPIRRGVRSYLPDFRVWEKDGSSRLHEVKGWMDARSRTTLRRMAKYHPSETIIVVREKDYNAIARKAGGMIEGWENSDRSGRL